MTKVFRDYDQAALDRAYDQAQWAANMRQVLKRRALASDAVRGRIGGPRTFAYGVTPIETLDLYPTGTTTSSCPRRWAAPTACSAAPCWSR